MSRFSFIGVFIFSVLFISIFIGFSQVPITSSINDGFPSVDDDYRISIEVSVDSDFSDLGDEDFVSWWIAADSHVGHSTYGQELETAVKDVNTFNTSFAVILGDLVHDGSEFVNQFDEAMNMLNHNWSYILGNHDFDRETGEPVKEVNYFREVVNGVQIIGLSDEDGDRTHTKVIGSDQDRWLKETLEENPELPTIMLTHHCPIDRAVTSFDDWLGDGIEEYNIVLWISGHAHKWDYEENIDGYGFDRLKITSLYHWGWWWADEEQSLFLSIERINEDKSNIHLEFRDHNLGQWISVEEMKSSNVSLVVVTLILIVSITLIYGFLNKK
ncbi:metallophosphoesterase [Methanonatronarchaeum sp. AMET-Sl]|uniref:metallophosphoesterase family protein n=1 Tax=Methanonatronarchaeum sp. AMET-Sl TaxID=3037654 RepID=UPI00244DE2C2|nr:metallophosphoesterase [Methanonatronarchaeum sp. AMET-Sl]WGI16684.1 metallophosphoesterase [Methanonatronarchaeum sp. AMET-Sl]